MKLLCIGDIHLGRRPSRLPQEVLDRLGGTVPGPAAAWRRAVEYAVAQGVDAVLLAGDVVEQADDFYEAYADLQAGVQRLAGAGIRVLAVAGNHDVEVLPRLAEAVDGVRLLGAGGRWEAQTIEGADGTRARVVGWSFPAPQAPTSPLAGGLPERDPLPTLGLLHCDRDQTGSRHAPVRSAELAAAPVDAWLLGHIHRPDALEGPRPSGYLGSLTGLDPGEPGVHGPWLLEVAADGGLAIGQAALAPLRWEVLTVPVDGLEQAADVHRRVTEAVAALHAEVAQAARPPAAVGCRLRFEGRTQLRAELERTLHQDDPRHAPLERDGVVYFVHDWRLQTLPAIDLEELARGTDPVGLLAARLLLLRGPDCAARRALIEGAQRELAAVAEGPPCNTLGETPPGAERTAEVLEAAALKALDDLLAQREAAG